MRINRSAANCLTTLCSLPFPLSRTLSLLLCFVQRFCADEWLHYAEICKKTPKNYIRTQREADWHTYALWAARAVALPRCGNYFFLCENKWNLHDTWVILHVNCFFWQTTQANTQDQSGMGGGVERASEGGKQTEMVAIVVFSVFTSVQPVPSRVSRSALGQLLQGNCAACAACAAFAALFTTQIAAGFTQAETNFTFSVCV